ncbi:MAG: hypothetical protein WD530_05475 [Vicingaceae bacterium]
MKKILITVLILALIVAGGIAFYQFNRGVSTLENVNADYEMTADDLYNAFETDEEVALEKYEGKVIQLSGKIADMKKTDKGNNLTLEAEGAMMGGVNCTFRALDDDLKVGDSIRLKGRCQGFLMNVVLNNCVLVYE